MHSVCVYCAIGMHCRGMGTLNLKTNAKLFDKVKKNGYTERVDCNNGRRLTEEWLSGRRRTIGNRVYVISVSGVQIPIPPPQGVAFEHAALLLLSERCCRYRFSNKTISNKAFRPLSDAETRCSRQLHKTVVEIFYEIRFLYKNASLTNMVDKAFFSYC